MGSLQGGGLQGGGDGGAAILTIWSADENEVQSGDITIRREETGETRKIADYTGSTYHTAFDVPDQTGHYDVMLGDRVFRDFTLEEEDVDPNFRDDIIAGWNGSVTDLTGDGFEVIEEEPHGSDNSVDPSNYEDIVNADTPSGVAFAPDEVRSGRTADPDGTEVALSDGRTVTVYPRQDADEAIRDPDTGDPVTTPVGSGGVVGGVGDSSSGGLDGMIGGAIGVVILLVAGSAALLGGAD
jgi:hypothetical protein